MKNDQMSLVEKIKNFSTFKNLNIKSIHQFCVDKHIYLVLILILGVVLRLSGLTTQSLWLDELHTMNEANPKNSLSEIFNILQNVDQHPPLYFYSIHYWFSIVGFTDYSARLYSAIIGILSILTTYLFAKALCGKRVALITTLLLSINYFHIAYSQEARDYILAYLFSTLSFYYLIKAIKNLTYQNTLLYGLMASLLMYSHYFGIFSVLSQVGIIFFVIVTSSFVTMKDKLLKFGAAGLLIVLLYGQWLPTIIHLSNSIKSFWIQPPTSDFLVSYFSDYFGNSHLLVMACSTLILGLLIHVFFVQKDTSPKTIGEDQSNSFALVFLFISILVTCFVPYIRSLLVVPMIISRYTIVILPSILILIALGLHMISSNLLRTFFIGVIVFLSFVNLLVEKKYYKSISKEQFKEQTAYVIANNIFDYPVYSDKSWYFNYYFNKQNKNVNNVIDIETLVKSHNDSTKNNGFWVLDAHGGNPYQDKATQDLIASQYSCIKENYLWGTWAKFYIKNNNMPLNLSQCTGGVSIGNHATALWVNSSLTTKPFYLHKGKHKVEVYCTGSKAANVFAHVNVLWNNHKIGDFYTNEQLKDYYIDFNCNKNEEGILSISFDNDLFLNGEDRSFFIKFLDIK